MTPDTIDLKKSTHLIKHVIVKYEKHLFLDY